MSTPQTAASATKTVTYIRKPERSFWQIWNMSFGFLGIQFGWGLQMANMSAIYEYLGARASQIPIFWLAAPLTGMIVQPLIGHASDHTWGRLGRRRPYFLTGAILSSLMLILMPNASALWMAAGMLWILDASINVSMEPFRAFVADLLPEGQRTSGFAMQSLFIGLGASFSSALPYILSTFFHVHQKLGDTRAVPTVVRISFYLGAVAFMGAVLWTVLTTKEYPPPDMEAFRSAKAQKTGLSANVREILAAIREMPPTMRRLGPVQFCTWLGLFCMWLYFPVAVAHNVFGANDTKSPLYQAGVEWGGNCFAVYSAVCFLFSFALPGLARKLGRKHTHSLCLLTGALGLMSVVVIHDKWLLLLTMVGVGIAWASTLSMPYAVLAASIPPERTGVYMGIFNFFIVTPEILASLFFGWIMIHLLGNNRIYAIIAGGVFLMIAALLMQRVRDPQTLSIQDA
ncbi:MFS transporter [Occallatibacter savannae]|uniref:MFS transporter n=1 Tax=Occallatibacter savannae TaxID=1002691 RepID=UPI000D688FFF|nr:MFS transporter [Occallatibacter savannae]